MCFSKNILRLQKSSITQKYAKNRSDFNTINSAGQWPTLRVISLGMRVGPSCQSHQDFRRILTYNLIFMLLVFCKLALVLCTFSTRMFCASRMENGERLTAWQAASTEAMPCLRFCLALQNVRPYSRSGPGLLELLTPLARVIFAQMCISTSFFLLPKAEYAKWPQKFKAYQESRNPQKSIILFIFKVLEMQF